MICLSLYTEKCPGLEALDFSDNAVSVLDETLFHRLPSLRLLNLSRNHLFDARFSTCPETDQESSAMLGGMRRSKGFSSSDSSMLRNESTSNLESLAEIASSPSMLSLKQGLQTLFLRDNPNLGVPISIGSLSPSLTHLDLSGFVSFLACYDCLYIYN